MILDDACQADSAHSRAVRALSRRTFLQSGAAAGGGLMLSLSLPFASSDAEPAAADGFAPNAFIRIERDGQIVLAELWRANLKPKSARPPRDDEGDPIY